jgi:aminoglycoside 3-N-acetyltransferase
MSSDLRGLGVPSGGVMLVHSSFRSLGTVPGGIETVVRGLIEAVGPSGTLLVPALSWRLRPPEIFDPLETPTNIGAIPEYFRLRKGTLRSVHPTHSVCGIGAMAAELLMDHHLDCTPCGSNSPFNRILDCDSRIVMLGCGLGPNTTMHALEERIEPLYFLGEKYSFGIREPGGRVYRKEYTTHGFAGKYAQRYDRVAEPRPADFIRKGHVLKADTYVIETMGLRDAVLGKLRENPFFFVDRISAEPGSIEVVD